MTDRGDSVAWVETALLDGHPDNPRLVYREDVIAGVAEQIKTNGFDVAHALLVRPTGERYQIVQGYHRWKAAQAVGLSAVPCWVREMGDDEAYMLLALGNVQGELSPLEIGRHALHAVSLGNGGSGQTGGLREYARQLGKTHPYLVQVRHAAEVFEVIKPVSQLTSFLDKAQHLSTIHGAPRETWQLIVDWMIDGDKSVRQVAAVVKAVVGLGAPEPWASVFLPLPLLADSYLKTESPTPEIVSALLRLAEQTDAMIVANRNELGEAFAYTSEMYHAWLSEGIGARSWQVAALQQYQRDIVNAAQAARKPPEPDAKAGEWYELGEHRLYCGDTGSPEFWQHVPSVPFAFADPPYNEGVGLWDTAFEWRHDWLSEKASVVAVTPGIGSLARFFRATAMRYQWSISAWIDNGMTRGALGFGNWIYVALFGDGALHKNSQDMIRCSVAKDQEREEFKGRKPQAMIRQMIELFTAPKEIVIDPFLGSGTTLLEAEKTGRRCIGGEIVPEHCNMVIRAWQNMTGQAARRIDADTL